MELYLPEFKQSIIHEGRRETERKRKVLFPKKNENISCGLILFPFFNFFLKLEAEEEEKK